MSADGLNRWDETYESQLADREIDLLLYRSNLLGADLRITNYGGGNTSCKTTQTDPLTGKQAEILWIKGSGGDLGSLKREGLASLYLDRFMGLKARYQGLSSEDDMVELFNYCLFDPKSKAPSIDTPLHAFLPFCHIDHLHPDAVIAFAAARDGEKITKELFGSSVGWIGWQRPGFDLGLRLERYLAENTSLRGIILASHGLFSWGETSRTCYQNTIGIIEQCADFLSARATKRATVFGGVSVAAEPESTRSAKAALLAPILRGVYCQAGGRAGPEVVGQFNDSEPVLQFVCSKDLLRLASMGTSCPDHFLRTKICPLVLDLQGFEYEGDLLQLREKIAPQFEAFRKMYAAYYQACARPTSPAMRNPNPVVILCPGIGMFSFASDKQTARVASEFYVNAINVMRGAEILSSYTALPRQEAFDIEYWLLEEAKLKRLLPGKSLAGKVAFITGGAGGIGKAIAKKFVEEGACIVLADNDHHGLESLKGSFTNQFGADRVSTQLIDVTSPESITHAIDGAVLDFGGLDILVNCAGLSISKPLEDHTLDDWELLYDVLVKGQFLVTQKIVRIMRMQAAGGDIINIVSKNALVSGPNNAAYGSAKAAQLHLSRLNAAELGRDRIRVNVVNPDAVITDSKIWSGPWAEGRAKAYGIKVEELPAYYAKRTLLDEIILPEDIAKACFVFVSGWLSKSTGNVLNVDGGVAAAFLR